MSSPLRRLVGRRLRAARGEAPKPAPPKAQTKPSPQRAAAAREPMLRALERGRSVDAAVVARVRSLISTGEHHRAESVAESLRRHEATAALGHLAGGIVAYRRGFRALAHQRFRAVPRELWVRFAAAEYARSGLEVARQDTLREIRDVVAADPPEAGAKSWYEMLAPVYGLGEGDLARQLFERLDQRVRETPPAWRDAERTRDWMRPWVAVDPDSRTAPPPPGGRRTFAIVDYGHPGVDRGSANIGDHVQSIAALGHLVRHRNVRLHGDDDLVAVLETLRERVRPERVRDGVDADVEVRTIHRDASMYEAVAEDTWVLCFGWYMHALFSMRHGFPLHRNLRPIFVSFHCNKRELLTPEALDYLRRYGPVGCRDWTTVYLLGSVGAPAFFSGCVTTTIDTVFGELPGGPPAEAPVAYVDVPDADVPPDGVTYRHSSEAVRRRSFTTNVRNALDLLETYRREHRAVVTSRLHCYLPLRSMGVNVAFRPNNPSDVRFEGLLGISDEAFAAMRDGLLGKLEQVFTAIAGGASEDDVYALWRDVNAEDVAAAEERRLSGVQLPPAAPDGGAGAQRRSAATEEAVHCAVIAGPEDERSLSVLIASLQEHASRHLHLHVLALPGTGAMRERLAEARPQPSFSWIPVADDDAATVRLALPDLLPGVARVVLLPLPSVATGDVAELAELDLGGHGFAAPARVGAADVSGFAVINAAANRLQQRTDAAATLRRTAYARHRFDFDAFATDVLVADLDRLRRDGFRGRATAAMRAYDLTELEALHLLIGPARAEVPERWAAIPTRTPARAPGLLHWADPVKPWHEELTPERELWRRYAGLDG